MSQLFEVAIIFDGIKQDTKLEDIQTMISAGKSEKQRDQRGYFARRGEGLR